MSSLLNIQILAEIQMLKKWNSSACFSSCILLQKPSTFPSSTCIDLIRGDSWMLYMGVISYMLLCDLPPRPNSITLSCTLPWKKNKSCHDRSNIYYYYQRWKQLCCSIFLWKPIHKNLLGPNFWIIFSSLLKFGHFMLQSQLCMIIWMIKFHCFHWVLFFPLLLVMKELY